MVGNALSSLIFGHLCKYESPLRIGLGLPQVSSQIGQRRELFIDVTLKSR
ncbi:hypothetical protein ACWCYZ_38130 [Streptomyces virginiae]